MAIGREFLVAAVREILGRGEPRTAREMASILRNTPRVGDVHRRDVNSVLYRELSREAVHDDDYRWSLRLTGVDANVTAQPRPEAPRMAAAQRPELLRAVSRLRSGLPPQERILDVTVGAEKLMLAVEKVIDADGPARQLLVTGNYGDGKSHSLALIADMARSTGLATCHLSADGAGAALNHPQRFLPQLLASLEIPGRTRNGYEDLLHQVLLDPQEARTLRDVTRRVLTGGREVDTKVSHGIARLLALHEAREESSEEFNHLARLVAYHLTGESISHRAGIPAARELVYRLLGVCTELLARLRAPGLVVVIDEAESIFTKLPNARSRRGAFRVLSALSMSAALGRCRVAIAMTPDAWQGTVAAVEEMTGDDECLPAEPVGSFGSAIASGTMSRIACEPPRAAHRQELVARVRALYALAYPSAELPPDVQARGVDLPVRLLVRETIDSLDRARYAQQDPRATRSPDGSTSSSG